MPYVTRRKAYLVIPIGLEKLVAGDLVDLTLKMREPIESLERLLDPYSSQGRWLTDRRRLAIFSREPPPSG